MEKVRKEIDEFIRLKSYRILLQKLLSNSEGIMIKLIVPQSIRYGLVDCEQFLFSLSPSRFQLSLVSISSLHSRRV